MASEEKGTDLRASLRKGSDEVYDLCCDPCSTENLNKEALGFCQDCNEYLCNSCCKHHAKLSATRQHTVVGQYDMPRVKRHSLNTKFKTKETDSLTETCPKHTNKLLEYVCSTHDKLCCTVCMTLDHTSCSGRSYIPDVADNIIKKGEYKRLLADLDKLVFMATGQKKKADDFKIENKEMQSKCFARIKSLRKQIDEMLDKLQKKAEHEVVKRHQENMDAITKSSRECLVIISELQAMVLKLKTKDRDGKINQLYVDTKLSSKQRSKLDQKLQNMNGWKIKQYEICENQKLKKLESRLSAMLSLSVQQDRPVIRARLKQQINVKSDEDTDNCLITGIAVLEGGRMVVTDGENEAVKLIDVKKNKVISRVSVLSRTRGVTQTEPNKVAVTLKDNTIVLFDVSNVLSKIKVIQIPNTDMYGICSYHGDIIVVCREPSCLNVINMSGKVLRTVEKGDSVLTFPSRVAISRDQTVVYVTDADANTVTTITTDNNVKSVYNSDNLECPVGVTVGYNGDVFVCSYDTHTIHQLSPSGQFIQILLDENHNLTDHPSAIAHSGDDNKLYISNASDATEMRNYIRVFQLE